MARVDLTNKELYFLQKDITEQMQRSPAFHMFHKEKIRRFFQMNRIVLEGLSRRMTDVQKRHLMFDKKGQPIMSDDGTKFWFNTPELEEAYNKEMEHFMGITVTVDV